jgi:hypothetical protein
MIGALTRDEASKAASPKTAAYQDSTTESTDRAHDDIAALLQDEEEDNTSVCHGWGIGVGMAIYKVMLLCCSCFALIVIISCGKLSTTYDQVPSVVAIGRVL